ncbi:ACT domain-containing protein [Streptomyces sp. JH34]|uniref:ACT domain-containing protein n=1 Tax=Streptomyces sp. JH34 TaxID=2793633 RepID=UPI0023F784FA|nr:ACT domain-containing protein [Streptomyces sp. JH34]MDF6022887.1 ACT domain-containing protein [Streptomyces sp. JH34]
MTGERDLRELLHGMRPELMPGRYVYATLPTGGTSTGRTSAGEMPAGVTPVVTVSEREGLTLVVPEAQAVEAGLPYGFVAGWITLRVHSALDAVGLTAAVSLALTDAGISCNVVAGYHHDHLFVPYARAAEAVRVLEALAAESG